MGSKPNFEYESWELGNSHRWPAGMFNITLLLALVEQYTINLIGSYVNIVLRMQDTTIIGIPANLLYPLYLLCYVLTFHYLNFLLKHGDLCELNTSGFPQGCDLCHQLPNKCFFQYFYI